MVELADHVVVLEAGRVVGQGTPTELIARGGWVARFAAAAHTESFSQARLAEDRPRVARDGVGMDLEDDGAGGRELA